MRTGWIAGIEGMGHSGISHAELGEGGDRTVWHVLYFQHNATQRDKILMLDKRWQST